MRILMASWRGPGHPLAGGAEQSTHEHAKAWVKRGHQVTLFTSYFKSAKKNEKIDGVKILRMGGDIIGVRAWLFYWYLIKSNQSFDLVVDEFHGIPFFTPLFVRVKKLAFIHEVAKEVWWFNPWPKPFNLIPALVGTAFERFIFTILYKNISFMTVSESTKKDLAIWGIPKRNIAVVLNGANIIQVSQKKEKVKTVIYLGALSKDKGIEDAIKAFGLLATKKGWQFWIVGKGDREYVEYLKKMCGDENISKSVKFWGFVDQKKKFELLSRAHVLLNPSIREGWGLVNIEANSAATPVVGYKVPGIVDSVKDKVTGALVEAGNITALANATDKLVNNSKQYNKIQKSAVNWSKEFTWESAVRKSISLIEK